MRHGLAPYIGFTEDEVKALCEQHHASFVKMQRWYDGYVFDQPDYFTAGPNEPEDDFASDDESDLTCPSVIMHVYSLNSVMEAIHNRQFQNYWSQTETYEDLKMYIEMDFDGLRQKVVDMLGGGRCRIVTRSFQNDMTSFKSASDVLTLLVHLSYLAYDSSTGEAFIPNEEVRDTWDKSAEGALEQIKDRSYDTALKEYKGNMLLICINYDKKNKEHQCKIEKYVFE